MSIDVPIKSWAIKHGYVSWKRRQGDPLHAELGSDRVRIRFLGQDIGERCVEWRYGRVRIGKAFMQQVPTLATHFRLTVSGPGMLSITQAE